MCRAIANAAQRGEAFFGQPLGGAWRNWNEWRGISPSAFHPQWLADKASRDGAGSGRLLLVPTPGSLPSTCANRLLGSGCRRSILALELTVSVALQPSAAPRMMVDRIPLYPAGRAGK